MEQGKTVILYFSHTGRTRKAARKIAEETGAPLCELRPKKPYPSSYIKHVLAVKWELWKGTLPELEEAADGWEGYDTVLLGFPIWWFTCPPVIASLLQKGEWKGKTIYPFCTHGGRGPKHAVRDIKRYCPEAAVRECLDANELRPEAISRWLAGTP